MLQFSCIFNVKLLKSDHQNCNDYILRNKISISFCDTETFIQKCLFGVLLIASFYHYYHYACTYLFIFSLDICCTPFYTFHVLKTLCSKFPRDLLPQTPFHCIPLPDLIFSGSHAFLLRLLLCFDEAHPPVAS